MLLCPAENASLFGLLILDLIGRAAFEYFLGQDSTYLQAFAKAYGLLLAQPALDAETAGCIRDLLQGVHEELQHLSNLAKVKATLRLAPSCTAQMHHHLSWMTSIQQDIAQSYPQAAGF